MKNTIMTIIAAIAFFGALSLVDDQQSVEPNIIYTADYPTLACPIEGACNGSSYE